MKKRIFSFFFLLFLVYFSLLNFSKKEMEYFWTAISVRMLADIIGAGLIVYVYLLIKKLILRIDLPRKMEIWGLTVFIMIIFNLFAIIYKG